VGICAHNEESSIGSVISNVLQQPLPTGSALKEVIVVASGCTDRTDDIVRALSRDNDKVRLISQPTKQGKASAINLILKEAKGHTIVLTDADVFPGKGSLVHLIEPFRDEQVGAVGGRPIPMDDPDDFWGFLAHLVWARMQNDLLSWETSQGIFFQLSGYLCAIRAGLIDAIPLQVIADDKYIGQAVRRLGYQVLYVPEAEVYLRGPRSIGDFFTQRVRVLTGHLQVKNWFRLDTISTSSPTRTLEALARNVDLAKPKEIGWASLAALLESIAHLMAWYRFSTGKVPYNWRPVPTTKPTLAYEA